MKENISLYIPDIYPVYREIEIYKEICSMDLNMYLICICTYTCDIYIHVHIYIYVGFPSGSDDKESACSAGNSGSIPGVGRSCGEGNGYPLQYSGLENSMDRGALQATLHGLQRVGHY